MCTDRTGRPSPEELRAAAMIHAGRASLAELLADLIDAERQISQAGGDVSKILHAAERIDALDLRDAVAPVLEGAETLQDIGGAPQLRAA